MELPQKSPGILERAAGTTSKVRYFPFTGTSCGPCKAQMGDFYRLVNKLPAEALTQLPGAGAH